MSIEYNKAVRKWIDELENRGWIGVDLDGTLAEHTTWHGPYHIGAPIPKMLARVKAWLAAGQRVKIMTARAAPDATGAPDPAVICAIQNYTEKHTGHRLEVTCQKDYEMIELWDDRAVQVIPNTGERADGKAE